MFIELQLRPLFSMFRLYLNSTCDPSDRNSEETISVNFRLFDFSFRTLQFCEPKGKKEVKEQADWSSGMPLYSLWHFREADGFVTDGGTNSGREEEKAGWETEGARMIKENKLSTD